MSRPMTADDSALDALLSRPMTGVTTSELRGLFVRGEKPESEWMIGAEIELFPLEGRELRSAGHATVGAIFEAVATELALELDREPTGAVIGAHGDGTFLSLEPGGQMEIATRPFRLVSDLRDAVVSLTNALARAGAAHDVRFAAMGHHPFADRDSIPKMPKARYELMRAYLPTRGGRGLDMMHLTGSVQCAVDYSDEANLIDKVQVAARASPFLAALVSSSPFFRGAPSGLKSIRYDIWRDVDDARAGIWPEMVDAEGLSYSRYLERALATPAMFFRRGGAYRMAAPLPFSSYVDTGFEGTTVTVADLVDHLTSLFPELRLKSYLELRGADCVPPEEAVGIAGFWRAILDDGATRAAARERLAGLDHASIVRLQPEVARLGLEAMSPIGPVHEVARDLCELAVGRLKLRSKRCADCVSVLLDRAERRQSPADEMLARYATDGVRAAIEPFLLRAI